MNLPFNQMDEGITGWSTNTFTDGDEELPCALSYSWMKAVMDEGTHRWNYSTMEAGQTDRKKH